MNAWRRFSISACVGLALTSMGLPAPAITIAFPGITLPGANGLILDGGDDQFDGGSVSVDGSGYSGGAAGALPNFTIGAQNISGINVSGRTDLLVPNGTTSANTRNPGLLDLVYARYYHQFTNTTGAVQNITVNYNLNLGSDGSSILAADSSGNATVGTEDLWIVTDDGDDGGPAGNSASLDPALGHLIADGTGVTPSAFSAPTGLVLVDFSLSLLPGETQSLLYFIASRNETDTFLSTASSAQSQTDVVAMLNSNALIFQGLAGAEAASVVNFSLNGVPEPSTIFLLAAALAPLGFARSRRHRTLTF